MTEHELQKPSAGGMHRFFVEFASIIMGLQYGKVGCHGMEAGGYVAKMIDETCDHWELHKDSVSHLYFYKQLHHLICDVLG